ncbi:MAG: tripartite tricarboxylate transporter substrate binding protein [Burkholderiales bacterium]|nr:tripartite tricarboxylate transporter substrate binding protein [Burkholderiales bacterium]
MKKLLLLALIGFAALAQAQEYPDRPVRIVIPTPPGGSVDGVARMVGAKLAEYLGQPMVFENRAGASTTLGAEVVAKSPPDGYTLYINASVHIINAHVLKSLPYDAVKDFTPIAELARGPLLFTIYPGVPAKSVKEFVEVLRADPKKYNFATSSFGAAGHLAIALFRQRAGVDIPIIQYKGTGQALPDLIGGQVSAMIDPVLSSGPQVKAGKLRALAITGTQRSPQYPDVPTVAEAGMPELEIYSWYGLWGPAKLPRGIASKLESAAIRAVQSADVRARMGTFGFQPTGHTASEFAAFIQAESAKSAAIIREANIRAE